MSDILTEILSGSQLAAEILEETRDAVNQFELSGIIPTLAVVVATDDEGTDFYVRHISKAAKKTGVQVNVMRLAFDAAETEIASTLTKLADDPQTHGIILQTPLPVGVNADSLRSLIPLSKDVDGANPLSSGRLLSGMTAFAPSTAAAVMAILRRYDIPVKGTHTVIVGRSRVVGKPLAHLMLDADATVTICHSKTRDLARITATADILVVAIGQPHFINAEHVKPRAIVIDVGTNATDDGLVGDVDSASVHDIAGAFSPVPGGIGPITTALLLKQTIQAVSKEELG